MSSNSTPSRQAQSTDEELGSQTIILMESLIDKLKLLNYEEGFIKTLKMRPLNRHYFALPINPGEQFFMFVALCSWLIQKCGLPFEQPQEDDDPNSTIAGILDSLRSIGISVDFSPNKLKKGSGLFALQCLIALVDKAISVQKLEIKKPIPPVEKSEDVERTDEDEGEDPELAMDQVEEEMSLGESDPDEDNQMDVDDLYLASAFMEAAKRDEIIESDVTAEAWNLELERVTPLLKVSIKSNSNDWRSQLELMKRHEQELTAAAGPLTILLGRLSSGLDETLRKVDKREKLLNSQFEPLLTQYRALQDELAAVNEQYREVNVGVVERQKLLGDLSDSLESVKQEMEERGATMSDGSPLVLLKKAIKDVMKEISEMDISIAVAEHSIVESKLREKSLESHLIRTSGI